MGSKGVKARTKNACSKIKQLTRETKFEHVSGENIETRSFFFIHQWPCAGPDIEQICTMHV